MRSASSCIPAARASEVDSSRFGSGARTFGIVDDAELEFQIRTESNVIAHDQCAPLDFQPIDEGAVPAAQVFEMKGAFCASPQTRVLTRYALGFETGVALGVAPEHQSVRNSQALSSVRSTDRFQQGDWTRSLWQLIECLSGVWQGAGRVGHES